MSTTQSDGRASRTMTTHVINCPYCQWKVQPSPFLGRALLQCPGCDDVYVVETDGASFSSSNVVASVFTGRPRRTVH